MKLKFYKIFPYIKIVKSLKNMNGLTKGVFVFIDKNTANPTTLEHEEVHVAIWWVVTLLSFGLLIVAGLHWYFALLIALLVDHALGALSKTYKFHEEALCYARSAYCAEDTREYVKRYKPYWDEVYGPKFVGQVRRYMRYFK